MAGTRVEVQLGINADVAAARRSIKDLENSLNKLYEAQAKRGFEDFGINKAIEGAQKLEQSLNRALDVDTGKLDLSKFSSSLKQTGTYYRLVLLDSRYFYLQRIRFLRQKFL